jgi:hypothetical protein
MIISTKRRWSRMSRRADIKTPNAEHGTNFVNDERHFEKEKRPQG